MPLPDNMKATVVNGHTFTVSTRFEPRKLLGRGSFGVVCTAYDSETNSVVAIKRIRPYANDEWDARHTLREIRLMRLLGDHPNIISLFNLAVFDDKSELYMVMELMDCDLHRIIQSKQALTDQHFKCFGKQMLEGLKAMHALGVFHRDLKPGNILVSKDCQLRITDFGLARFMDDETLEGNASTNPMTEYVVTRWYRCPELLLSPTTPYTEVIDLWSVGCILGELMKRKPLFPGKSHPNQVQLILEVQGFRKGNDLGFPLSAEATSFLERKCQFRGTGLAAFIPSASKEALGLLSTMLMLDPNNRPTAQQALDSPYFADAQLAVPQATYDALVLQPACKGYFSFDKGKHSIETLQGMIRGEVASAAKSEAVGGVALGPEATPSTSSSPADTRSCPPSASSSSSSSSSSAAAAAAAAAAAGTTQSTKAPTSAHHVDNSHPAGPFYAAVTSTGETGTVGNTVRGSTTSTGVPSHDLKPAPRSAAGSFSRQSSSDSAGSNSIGPAPAPLVRQASHDSMVSQVSQQSATSILSAASTLASNASASSGLSGMSARSISNAPGNSTPSPRKQQQLAAKDRKQKQRIAMKDMKVGSGGAGAPSSANTAPSTEDIKSLGGGGGKILRALTPGPHVTPEASKGSGGIVGASKGILTSFRQALSFTRPVQEKGKRTKESASSSSHGSSELDNQNRRVYRAPNQTHGSASKVVGRLKPVPVPVRSSSARAAASAAAAAVGGPTPTAGDVSSRRSAGRPSLPPTHAHEALPLGNIRPGQRRNTFGDPVGSFALAPVPNAAAAKLSANVNLNSEFDRDAMLAAYGAEQAALEEVLGSYQQSSSAAAFRPPSVGAGAGAGAGVGRGAGSVRGSVLPSLGGAGDVNTRRRSRDRRSL